MITIGIVVGSTRPGRIGALVGGWVARRAGLIPEARIRVLDLLDLGLPFLDEADHPSEHRYTQPHTLAWSQAVSALDAVVLVTPEYNSSFPAPLKNALDYLCDEWRRKPVGIVGYGNTSAGTRAVAALLPVITALHMLPAGAVQLSLLRRLDTAGVLRPAASDDAALDGLLEELVALVTLLHPIGALSR